MAFVFVFTHLVIIRRKWRGITPLEINTLLTTFDKRISIIFISYLPFLQSGTGHLSYLDCFSQENRYTVQCAVSMRRQLDFRLFHADDEQFVSVTAIGKPAHA